MVLLRGFISSIVLVNVMISVCIATYNGGPYIREQLDSILMQIPCDSEVLLGDDCSSDETVSVAEAMNDPRIKIIRNISNLGYVKNFENLIASAKGDYIFLSDQDDIWVPGRVSLMLEAMHVNNSLLVVGSMVLFDNNLALKQVSAMFKGDCGNTRLSNIVGIFVGNKSLPYFGCCMLLSKELLQRILPFRSSSVSHDIWIALVSNIEGSVCHLTDIVTYRRIHGGNVTRSDRNIFSKIITRVGWVAALVKYFLKLS